MSQISRRLFLHLAASAAPAVALATGTGAALAASAGAGENPELLALEQPLHDAVAALRGAVDRRDTARQLFVSMAPDVPEELQPGPYGERRLAEQRMDHDGNPLLDRTGRAADVFRSTNLRHALKDEDGRTARGRWLKATLAKAEAFEAADGDAYAASGFQAAVHAHSRAISGLRDVTEAIRAAEPRTLHGLTIQAQAVLAMKGIGDMERSYYYTASAGPLLAAAILAVANIPAPEAAVFDYEAAIAKLEGMGVQLAAAVNREAKCDGVSFRENGVHPDAINEVLSHRRGFCPIRMGEVLLAQGKVARKGWRESAL